MPEFTPSQLILRTAIDEAYDKLHAELAIERKALALACECIPEWKRKDVQAHYPGIYGPDYFRDAAKKSF